jgi:hypothetical protein
MPDHLSKAQRYRARAHECRCLADLATSAETQKEYARIAEYYDQLAQASRRGGTDRRRIGHLRGARFHAFTAEPHPLFGLLPHRAAVIDHPPNFHLARLQVGHGPSVCLIYN